MKPTSSTQNTPSARPDTDSDPNSTFEPFFIVGAPRSGTTLLTVMLDRHSSIAMTPETKIFRDMRPQGKYRTFRNHEAVLDSFLFRTHLIDLRLEPAEVLDRFRDFEPTCRNYVRCVLETYRIQQGKPRIGEKTPEHMWDVPTILDWYPRSKIIWLLRDGHDVVLSIDRLFKCGVRRACFLWWQYAKFGQMWERRYPERFRRVTFESLVAQPKETLSEVLEILGLEFEPSMLNTSVKSETVPEHEMGHKRTSLGALNPSKVGEYHRLATVEQQAMMAWIIDRQLVLLGYTPTDVAPVPARTRLTNALKNPVGFLLFQPWVRRFVNAAGLRLQVTALWRLLTASSRPRFPGSKSANEEIKVS
jgi:hypothetical protein